MRTKDYCCLFHGSRIDIFFTRESGDKIHSDTVMSVPGSVYLQVEGTLLLRISMRIGSLTASDIKSEDCLANGKVETYIYDGKTSNHKSTGNVTLLSA